MSRSLNKVMLMGNLGNDPEVRTTAGGGKVASFSLATSRTWNDQSGVRQEKTEWHKCVAWNQGAQGKLADIVEQYCKKGKPVFVEGAIEYRQWQDKEGQTRYSTEIRVRELILLGSRGDGDGDSGNGASYSRPAPSRSSTPATKPAAAGAKTGSDEFSDFPGALEDEEDDLPF